MIFIFGCFVRARVKISLIRAEQRASFTLFCYVTISFNRKEESALKDACAKVAKWEKGRRIMRDSARHSTRDRG